MKKILEFQLRLLSAWLLKKYQPEVIGITGSVGKTTAKEALQAVLSAKFVVRATAKNYNNEIGVPLTIIGCDSPGRNYLGWLKVIFTAIKLLLIRDYNYPKILVLELGVDHPGDMSYLTKIAKPQVGVVTLVGHAHLEFFGTVEKIKKEKQGLIESLPPRGLAVLNYDDILVRDMAGVSRAKVIFYGCQAGADLRADDLRFNFEKEGGFRPGLSFKLEQGGASVPVFLRAAISDKVIFAALASAAVALHYGMNLIEIAAALENFNLPPGRMQAIHGIKGTMIIDDTYNASPDAAIAALDVIARAKLTSDNYRLAIFGDMLELGAYTEEGHELVGQKAFETGIDQLILVGSRAKFIGQGAKKAGMSEDNIFYFDRPEEAGHFASQRIKSGDLVLVKGSQGARMEKTVKEIMAEPQRAKELLVRQGSEWLS